MTRVDARRIVRSVARAVAALSGVIALIALAWVLSNLRDIDPVPRLAALALPMPQVPDENNAFFALIGLHAAADRDPAAAGRASWRIQLDYASHARPARDTQAAEAMQRAEKEVRGEALPRPSGPPLVCSPNHDNCSGHWIENADALAAQRQSLAVLGQRCERLLDERFQFEERLPPFTSAADPIAPHIAGAASCSQWLLSGAALAWAAQRRSESFEMLVKAVRLDRALLGGGQSLVAQMVALRLTQNTMNTIAALASRDRDFAPNLARLLLPWPDQATAARRWMAAEAAFGRGALTEVSNSCFTSNDQIDSPGIEVNASWSPADAVTSLACRHRIGWHPERILAATDDQWLQRIARLDAGLPTAIESLARQAKMASEISPTDTLAWRNTLGNQVIVIGNWAAAGSYVYYLARQTDLELHREATVLALSAMAVAPAERAAWITRQPQSMLTQGRLTWDATGQTLTARSWQQDYAAGPGYNAARDAIQIILPNP